ncbi:MAG: Serine acetyltransferase [Firmicutes bacterium ADurb.Bin419]|nr:MAG: Serine acetyltransferase [Firmicutes bacterium ADurb.Bin419]
MFKQMLEDAKSIAQRDPAAKNSVEVILLYPGFHAVCFHRLSHWFYKHKLFFIARMISQIARFLTGVEIHPGAVIGRGLFIDHGMGIVIGETAEIGDNCTIYHNVTLGGTGKDTGKRHPTIGNNVLISAGAKILGPFKVGDNSRIGANAVVLNEVEPNTTVVGVPGRAVKRGDKKLSPSIELDQVHIPDPVAQELCKILYRMDNLENLVSKGHDIKPEDVVKLKPRDILEQDCKKKLKDGESNENL